MALLRLLDLELQQIPIIIICKQGEFLSFSTRVCHFEHCVSCIGIRYKPMSGMHAGMMLKMANSS